MLTTWTEWICDVGTHIRHLRGGFLVSRTHTSQRFEMRSIVLKTLVRLIGLILLTRQQSLLGFRMGITVPSFQADANKF
jgi:hypothetical protein